MPLRPFRLAPAALAVLALATLPAGAQPAPQPGGVLRIAIDTDPQCLDPQQAGNNNSLNVGRQITDSLTDQRPDTGALVPWLAASWSVSADNLEFTFQLRDDASFSDGTPVDAAAVKANLEGIVKLGARASLGAGYLAGLREVRIPDSRTVTVAFAAPNIQFLQATSTMSLGLLAPATLARSAEERCQGQLVGSGPFTVARFVHNQQVRLNRRDDYAWPSALARHQGRAHLEGIEYRVIPESGVRTGSLVSRQIDVNASVPPQDERLLLAQQLPVLARANPGLVYSFFPNEADPLLRDPLLRQAIVKAVNRAELQSIISRFQAPASAVLAKTTPLYSDLSALLAHDPDGSRQLLEEAGWRPGQGGIRERDGQRLVIRLSYWQSTPFLELVQQQLRAVGIDLQLNRTTISQVTALRDSGSYQLQFFNLTRADPDILRAVFGSSGRNVNNRAAAPVDALLQASSAELDPTRRRDLVAQAERALIEAGHVIPLVELSTVIATGKNVHGLDYEASSRLQLYDTWLGR
ncbi:ABC transporter substrate-binding protein [Roseomonas sp. 18066]|uniref:ABC transporter substrate-binding protein n=1 Tax=Roseomonas sp. 18066 TaxID=2681412 RepID=UPI001359DF8C|nr:ABC transporter substrate-binding protein [Roseomonas sp. 18066]